MSRRDEPTCLLCRRCEENKQTGPMSSKDDVTAHQNCLLFASALVCHNSPQFDDLFGFTVDDVMIEVQRGNKLRCKKCGRKGATAGCEVKRCQKSFHYPCAVEAGVTIIEDMEHETYTLYCSKHNPKKRVMAGDAPAASRQYSSDSNSSSSAWPSSSKKRSKSIDKQDAKFLKRFAKRLEFSDESSPSDEKEPDPEMAPLDEDDLQSIGGLENFAREPQSIRKDTECPTASTSGKQLETEGEDEDETMTIDSDDESTSLLPSITHPLHPMDAVSALTLNLKTEKVLESLESSPEHRPGPSVPPQSSTPHSDNRNGASLLSRSIDATSFWKSCNAAGCTQGIFSAFIDEMVGISSRIQSGQASQEDCDHALTVITASGKLEELVAKQQEDLWRKQAELQKAMEAMEQVVSALRR